MQRSATAARLSAPISAVSSQTTMSVMAVRTAIGAAPERLAAVLAVGFLALGLGMAVLARRG